MILNWQFLSTHQKHHLLIVKQFLYSVFKIHLTCNFEQPYKECSAWKKKKKKNDEFTFIAIHLVPNQ